MENHTIAQLTAIAKERGIKGYYKLRQTELINALEATRLVEQKSSIFDEPILNDPTPALQPTPWRPSNLVAKSKQNIKSFAAKRIQTTTNFFTKDMQKIKDFGEWLLNYIPPKPKVVDKVLESLKRKFFKMYENRDSSFQPTQTKSALKNFAIQYRIDGSNGYEPESFLLNSKQPITNLMINSRQTKVKLILLCMMEKVDLKSVQVIAKQAYFILKKKLTQKVLTVTK